MVLAPPLSRWDPTADGVRPRMIPVASGVRSRRCSTGQMPEKTSPQLALQRQAMMTPKAPGGREQTLHRHTKYSEPMAKLSESV